MTRLHVLAFLGLLACGSSGLAAAECREYRKPPVWSNSDFLKYTSRGSLAIRFEKGRVFPLIGGVCFDLSGREFGDLMFDLNSTGESGARYFAAAVTRSTALSPGVSETHTLTLRRNGSSYARSDKWLRVLDGEDETEAGIALSGNEFSVKSEYDPAEAVTTRFVPAEFDLKNGEFAQDWHAVLSEVPGRQSPNRSYEVIANSRDGIQSLVSNLDDLVAGGASELNTKIYLLKFLASPSPSLSSPILLPGSAECMYITFGIGGMPDSNLSDTLRTIVLKLTDRSC